MKKDGRKLTSMTGCEVCCFWLAPDGTSSHLGDRMGRSHHSVAYNLDDPTGGRDLEDKGYLHVSYGSPFFAKPGTVPTQAQLDRLFDIQQELASRKLKTAEYIGHFLTITREKVPA